MKRQLTIFLATLALALAPISANAVDRATSEVTCPPGWPGVVFKTEARGCVLVSVWGGDGTHESKPFDFYDGYHTFSWTPPIPEYGDITAVDKVRKNADPGSDVRYVESGCQVK